jgi:hypothetical protein
MLASEMNGGLGQVTVVRFTYALHEIGVREMI